MLRLRESAPSGRRLDLVFRAYDEGAAFRYRVPSQPGLSDVDLVEENSTFFFPEGCRAWVLQLRDYATNYESEFNPQPLWRLQPGAHRRPAAAAANPQRGLAGRHRSQHHRPTPACT